MTDTPGKKYYKGRLYQHGKMFPYIVWDGVCDYKNHPSPELLTSAELCGPNVTIAQIGKPPHNIRETLTALVKIADSVILWARDHATYRVIIDEMKAQADIQMQLL